ncbi:hypothetical protein PsYK624_172140 [Phanerochaete sordida]|uniref:Uncharacterized protein n=1 Tax=Phanerochaete sordida TaxID=48140 RepID=A0A9P3GZ08_9APHY|nr:hypothetical protein PsYK624_172140 [Phanerochaete sordida]
MRGRTPLSRAPPRCAAAVAPGTLLTAGLPRIPAPSESSAVASSLSRVRTSTSFSGPPFPRSPARESRNLQYIYFTSEPCRARASVRCPPDAPIIAAGFPIVHVNHGHSIVPWRGRIGCAHNLKITGPGSSASRGRMPHSLGGGGPAMHVFDVSTNGEHVADACRRLDANGTRAGSCQADDNTRTAVANAWRNECVPKDAPRRAPGNLTFPRDR